MISRKFIVFGVGVEENQLCYIGYSMKSFDSQRESLISDLMENNEGIIDFLIKNPGRTKEVTLFEIESFISDVEAKESVSFWCEYYKTMGMDIISVKL